MKKIKEKYSLSLIGSRVNKNHAQVISRQRKSYNIKIFKPLPVPNSDAGVTGNAVWALDETHLVNYLLPRDCPRITYALSSRTSDLDRFKFFSTGEDNKRMIIVEDTWLEKIQNTVLYVYEFNVTNSKQIDAGAGYYISRNTEKFISCQKIENLIEELKKRNVILKSLPNLWDKIDEVAQSSLEFSIIRKRNATPRKSNF